MDCREPREDSLFRSFESREFWRIVCVCVCGWNEGKDIRMNMG